MTEATNPWKTFHGSSQVTGNQTFSFTYGYNYAGGLKTETYPSGRSVTFGFDTANRQTSVNGTMDGQNTQYINSAGYAPNGGLIGYFLNNGQLTLSTLYNMHQQVSHLAVAYNNNYKNQNYFYQTMDWGTSGNNGVRLSGKKEYISNNGPLPSTPTFSQTFGYDGVNRLTTASETGGWAQTYGYDQYGNMWMPTNGLTSTNQSVPSSNVYNGNNQNPNFSYDAAGNQTTFGSLTLSYDAENRQSKIVDMGGGTGTFQYDGLGHRVVKVLPSSTSTYVYDGFGQMAAEYYRVTSLPVPPCSTCYLTHDYLGSVRLVTDAGANVVARHDFAPFGQEIPSGTNGRGSAWGLTSDVDAKFTGQVRDQESGLDFFNARYFAAGLGRFNSPDPGNAGASLMNSQSWNGYGYVLGNPLEETDPLGLFASACQVNIALVNQSGLKSDQLAQTQAEINRILGMNNSGLSANFASRNPDFTVTLRNNPSGLLWLFSGVNSDVIGKTDASWWSGNVLPNANVFVNNAAAQDFPLNLGVTLGRAVTHEFTHWAFNFQHNYASPGSIETNISQAGFGIYDNTQQASFSQSQTTQLQNRCASLHPTSSPSAGGGGTSGTSYSFFDVIVNNSGPEGPTYTLLCSLPPWMYPSPPKSVLLEMKIGPVVIATRVRPAGRGVCEWKYGFKER